MKIEVTLQMIAIILLLTFLQFCNMSTKLHNISLDLRDISHELSHELNGIKKAVRAHKENTK